MYLKYFPTDTRSIQHRVFLSALISTLAKSKTDQTQKYAEAVWKALRSPFVLPPSAQTWHKCDWEMIDFGLAGCRLCGSIHCCSADICEDTCQEDDHLVCTISGLCLRPAIATEEFMDTCIPTHNPQMDSNDQAHSRNASVELYVQELLHSDQAYKVFALQKQKVLEKIARSMQVYLNANKDKIDVLKAMSQGVEEAIIRPVAYEYDAQKRMRLVAQCVANILQILSAGSPTFKLNIKTNDFRNTVFGLVYLLKQGIYIGASCVIPSIPELDLYLPNESNVERFFGFRAKYITDVENKCKYIFRVESHKTSL